MRHPRPGAPQPTARLSVVIVGGYGVFGGRLARLLLRDGQDVRIAGRDARKAERFAAQHGGQALALDIQGDLSALADVAPDVVIDAAGPFQAYRTDPHRLARFCIAHGIDYLDLSDDAAFTAGIRALDEQAKAAGRFALSGVSSVPALSSSAVAALADGLSAIDLIETAIMPGNRAPRGRSVVAGILSQVGAPIQVWRGGAWRHLTSWSDRREYWLDPKLHRAAWAIAVPDLELFPDAFGARSVLFRAGLELSVMNAGLRALAVLRRSIGFQVPGWLLWTVHRLAALLEPFGSDRGAMVVEVTGSNADTTVMRRWVLVAEAGEGPFVPAVAARALLRHHGRIAPGARPCLHEASLAEMEEAMSHLAVTTRREETPRPTLFQAALGAAWHELSAAVRRVHTVNDLESFTGCADVTRGTGALARLAAWIFGLPPSGRDVPVTVTMTRTAGGETWTRDFAGRRFRSHLAGSRPSHITERFGAFTFELALQVADGALHWPVAHGWVFGIPLPRILLPRGEVAESERDGAFRFDVAVHAPLGGGLIVDYRGTLSPDADAAG